MLNRRTDWNEIANVGNPTRSNEVNDLIGAIKRMETARLGVESKARRALYPEEFEQAIAMMEEYDDEELATFLIGFFRFQLAMIARGDDSAKFRLPEVKAYHKYPLYGFLARLCWAKNCHEERDAPLQLLVGSMDRRYCVLIGLGLWMEYHFMLHPEDNEFVFGVYGDADPILIKEHAYDALRLIFKDDEFNAVDDGKTGTHSMRKLACDMARNNGCDKDDVDHRGRWRGDKRQQDDYTSTTIPFVDAKVAFALARGGGAAYMQREESGMTDQVILDYVVPHLSPHVPRQVALVLGRALHWQICDDSRVNIVPEVIRHRVEDATRSLGEGENPRYRVEGAPIQYGKSLCCVIERMARSSLRKHFRFRERRRRMVQTAMAAEFAADWIGKRYVCVTLKFVICARMW